jgi:hypothetical protein
MEKIYTLKNQHVLWYSLIGLSLLTLSLFSVGAVASANNDNGSNKSSSSMEDKKRSEITMESSGKITIRSATVTGISGNTITAQTTLGGAVLTWTISTDTSTQFINKNNRTLVYSDIVVGDVINVNGVMNSGSTLSLKATTVRDTSKTESPSTLGGQIFEGTLVTLPAAALPTTLGMTIQGVNKTVALTNTTVVLNKAWASTTLNTFVAGDTVRVFGYTPAGSANITAIVLRNATR